MTHMPPELLSDGLLSKATDAWSFGECTNHRWDQLACDVARSITPVPLHALPAHDHARAEWCSCGLSFLLPPQSMLSLSTPSNCVQACFCWSCGTASSLPPSLLSALAIDSF